MQRPTRYTFIRRLLFPYSGEEPLSPKQALRVILAWGLTVPLIMSLCTLSISVVLSFTVYKTILFLIVTFLSGVVIFGLLGLVVVSMSNQAARIRQERKAREGQR